MCPRWPRNIPKTKKPQIDDPQNYYYKTCYLLNDLGLIPDDTKKNDGNHVKRLIQKLNRYKIL